MISSLLLRRRDVCHTLDQVVGEERGRSLCHEWTRQHDMIVDSIRSAFGLTVFALAFAGLGTVVPPIEGGNMAYLMAGLFSAPVLIHMGFTTFLLNSFKKLEAEIGSDALELAHMHAKNRKNCHTSSLRPKFCNLD